jgi:predicted metal-dependent enzyme (double-stranded beta helix superfamily)
MDGATTRAGTPTRLHELADAIRAGVRSAIDPRGQADRAAAALRSFLNDPGLLLPSQREPDPSHYRQHILHVEDDGAFSIVALVWLPGQATPIHDHVSWCVVGVYEGQEHETRYRLAQDGSTQYLVEDGVGTNPHGSIAALTPPGDIHCVENRGPGAAISLHVYGADIRRLGSSIRRSYHLTVRGAGEQAAHRH